TPTDGLVRDSGRASRAECHSGGMTLAHRSTVTPIPRRHSRMGWRSRGSNSPQSRNGSRRAELTREIGRLTDAIAEMGLSPALRSRLEIAERELEGLDQPTVLPVSPADAR